MTGRTDRSDKNIRNAVKSVIARLSDPRDGIYIRVFFELGNIHRVSGIDQDDDFFKVFLRISEKRLFVLFPNTEPNVLFPALCCRINGSTHESTPKSFSLEFLIHVDPFDFQGFIIVHIRLRASFVELHVAGKLAVAIEKNKGRMRIEKFFAQLLERKSMIEISLHVLRRIRLGKCFEIEPTREVLQNIQVVNCASAKSDVSFHLPSNSQQPACRPPIEPRA